MSRLDLNNLEILEDGKNNWKIKKMDSLKINESYLRLANKNDIKQFFNISNDILNCGSYLNFKLFEDGTKKLNKANFCRRRLCPMCNWRRSKKVFSQVSKVVNEIDKTDKYGYIFLTLTLKNCIGNDLENNINLILKSFKRMLDGSKRVKNICKGYFRALEVTYNAKESTYHPHIHCIIVVNKSYFTSRDYITTEEWANIWQYYLKVDYKPIVDVRKVKSKNYKYSGVSEISKYTVKSKDIILKDKDGQVDIELTDNNVYTLHFALYGKRLIGMGGLFKELHKKLNLEDMNSDNVNLINTEITNDDSDLLNYIILKYQWNVGLSNYKLVKNEP